MDVFKNLVPNSWRGWVVALVGLLISFWVYYGLAYETILSTYQETFLAAPVAGTNQFIQDNHLSITLLRPKNIAFSDFVERECIVRIENQGPNDVQFWLTAQGISDDVEPSPLRIRSEANYQSEEYKSAFNIDIPAHSIQEVALYLSLEQAPQKQSHQAYKLALYLKPIQPQSQEPASNHDSIPLTFEGESLTFPYKPMDAFRESVVKFFLFPPLSNVFLVSVVLFVVGGVENRKTSVLFYVFSLRWTCLPSVLLSFLLGLKWAKWCDWKKFVQDLSEIVSWMLCSAVLFLSSLWFGWNIILWENCWSVIFSGLILVVVILLLLLNIKETSPTTPATPAKSAVE